MKGCALQTASFMPRLQRLIDAADGPALVVRPSGECLAANAAARPLCEALRRRDPELRGLILSATAGGTVTGRVVFDGDSEARRAFEISVVPEVSDLFLLVARDVTMEDNLTHALLRSRDLYKDLMACSADFGWETDAAGVFTYISPGGALGYSPRELFGQLSQAILGLGEHAGDNVFSTRQAQRGARIWVRARDGTRVLLVVSAVPVHDKKGEWVGARGVARDITREHEREAALRLEQASQALMGRIIVAIRSEAEPEDILRAAAQSAAQALRAEAAVILARRSKEKTTIAAPLAESADLDRIARDALTASDADAEEEVSVGLDAGERQCLTTCIAASAELRAAIVFARDAATEPWRAHEIELVHGMAGHLSIALKQAEILERLEALSRHDDLTGLLNRRALMTELADRLAQARRHGRKGCLLLIDLDHFKALNDSHGHAAGDAALRALGSLLRGEGRPGDLAARLGGDEFALWLEETDAKGAIARAKRLLASIGILREATGTTNVRLSMSIGIAPFDADRDHDPNAIIAAADGALYAAKNKGRATYALAAKGTDTGMRRQRTA